MHKTFIYHRSRHHAIHSGYAKLLDHVEGKIVDGLNTRTPYKLSKLISSNIPTTAGIYDSQSVNKEVELFKTLQSISKVKSIVHYLNAERDIRYNLKLRRNFPLTKFVATFHRAPTVLKEKITNLKYLKKLDAAVCVGENQVDFIKNWLGSKQVRYIPHGVDTFFFKPDLNLKKEHSILFVGRHLRDFDTLNWAIPKFEKFDPSLKVKIVGMPSALEKVKQYKNVIKFSGIDDNTLKTLYLTSKILFLPLRDGTACNSILEAMACGLPIITNKIGGNEAYLKGTNSCFEDDREILYKQTVDLLENEEKQKANSQKLRKKAMEYEWSHVAEQVENFHQEITAEL